MPQFWVQTEFQLGKLFPAHCWAASCLAITVAAGNWLLHRHNTRLLSKAKFIYATLINPHETPMEAIGQTGHISIRHKSALLHPNEGSHINLLLLEKWAQETWWESYFICHAFTLDSRLWGSLLSAVLRCNMIRHFHAWKKHQSRDILIMTALQRGRTVGQ